MPRSVEKDYYIWRFLSQRNTTVKEARLIIQEADRLNTKLKEVYKKKTGQFPRLKPKPPLYTTTQGERDNWKRRVAANKQFKNGIKLVERNQLKSAENAFYEAFKGYSRRWEKDKALFWLYLVSKDKAYLKELRKSYHINMYTLLAADIVNEKYPRTIITPSVRKSSLFWIDEKDPIHWAKLKAKMNLPNADLEELADDCESQATIGMHTYLKAKACNHTKSYFPMPYRNMMKRYTKERQALIYAIARQESRFIPASISRSFALGMMQIMPFLVKHIAKEKGEKIDLDMMFSPHKAIEYADHHLDYLTKYLYHPLFVAYAYNGGIGFTKRLITNGHYFKPAPFEPYLSMEKMDNEEAREYGKRVLTNYVIYLNKLGISTRLLPFLKTVTNPKATDRFRK